MKKGDRGWVLEHNNAIPGIISNAYQSHADNRHFSRTMLKVTLDSGEVVSVYPDCFLTDPREVEQIFQERIDFWNQRLEAFKKTL